MMKFTQLLLVGFFLKSEAVSQITSLQPFTLTGVINGMDSGYVYLNYIPDGGHGILDSCKVINGKFLFKGHLTEPTRATFATFGLYGVYNNKNYTEFYIEPAKMKIMATYNHFKNLHVTGSSTDQDRLRLNKIESPVTNSIQLLINRRKKFEDQYIIRKKLNLDSTQRKKLLNKIDSLKNLVTNFYRYKAQIDSGFIAENLNSYFSVDKLYNFREEWLSFNSLVQLYQRLPMSLKQSTPGRQIRHKIDKEIEDSIGSIEKAFTAINSRGDTIRLEDYKGHKYVLLDFGASWCEPCKRIIPYLKAEYDKYDTALEIISISNQDEIDDWRKGIKEDNTKWPQIIENKMIRPLVPIDLTITDMYYIDIIPSLILIDKSGKIVNKYGGFYDSKSDFLLDLDAQLKKIFETERDILNK